MLRFVNRVRKDVATLYRGNGDGISKNRNRQTGRCGKDDACRKAHSGVARQIQPSGGHERYNDIYTKEDEQFLIKHSVLPEDRIIGVETGGCPHTAIREDASMNFAAIDELKKRHPDVEIIFIESGGDNLAATFSPELVDFSIYMIDVTQGEKIPRKGGQGMIKSDLLVINKIDLAPYVGARLEVMERDAKAALCM